MRRRMVLTGIVLLLVMRASTLDAQSTGGSFGGSRGFGGSSGSSSGSGSSSSSSGSGSSFGGGSSSGSGWSGSSSGSSNQDRENEARRREEEQRQQRERERQEAERLERERLERERLERERLEAERRERERLERELALPPSERAKSDRFTESFAFAPRTNALAPAPGASSGAARLWWGGSAPGAYIYRSSRWSRPTVALASLAMLAIIAATIVRIRTIKKPAPPSLPRGTVRVLSVGIDWTRRRQVQQRLAERSGAYDLSTAAGMFSAWHDVRSVLRDAISAVRYVSLSQSEPLVSDAEREFSARANDLRGRYIIETVTDAARGVAPSLGARSEEGEGLVVVSVIAGFNRALPAISPTTALDAMIASLCGDDPETLVALQTVWSPTHEDDRMSSAELEARYPELRRLDDGVGRVQCASCRAVWAKELGRCPACGAPPG